MNCLVNNIFYILNFVFFEFKVLDTDIIENTEVIEILIINLRDYIYLNNK